MMRRAVEVEVDEGGEVELRNPTRGKRSRTPANLRRVKNNEMISR
jgi:hypothetical protein